MSGSNGSSGSVDVSIGVHEGKVVARWQVPTNQIVFDPQNAFQVGEAMARAAHEARYGVSVQTDESYIAEQVRARVTENLRARMVSRFVLMFGSMERQRKTPKHIAEQMVDALLREIL
jgi:hypothetical protein